MFVISFFILAAVFFVIGLLSAIIIPSKMQKQNKTILQIDIDECHLIRDLSSQEECFMNLLMRTKNRNICNYINGTSKDECYNVANKF
ncbi:MAG: hypothetical protein Q8L29_04430 [archaeon]|nr:hypothetical protein [archaeon]